MSDRYQSRTALHVALVVLALVVLLYSLLVAARPLVGLSVVAWLFAAYLAWRLFGLAVRFVAAFERIADAMETRADEQR